MTRTRRRVTVSFEATLAARHALAREQTVSHRRHDEPEAKSKQKAWCQCRWKAPLLVSRHLACPFQRMGGKESAGGMEVEEPESDWPGRE